MKKMMVAVAVAGCAAVAWAGEVGEIVPGTVNFQAKLARMQNGAAVPLTGIQHVAFRLYDAPEGGTLVWAREFPVTCTGDGIFNLVLDDGGSKLGSPAEEKLIDAFQGTARHFELEVEGVGTLRPRMRVPTAPYAFSAQYALWGEGGFSVGAVLNVADDAEFMGKVAADGGSVASLSVNGGSGTLGGVKATGTVTVPPEKPNEANGVIPVGGILMWTQSNIPDGWALCNGENGTPDLTSWFVMGAGGGHNVGETGGAATVTLSIEQLPPHTHGYIYPSSTSAGKLLTDNYNGYVWTTPTNVTTTATGGNAAHENRPPFYAVYYIMRVR